VFYLISQHGFCWETFKQTIPPTAPLALAPDQPSIVSSASQLPSPALFQAIKAGNTLYVSGQIGIVPGTKDFASEGVEGQTEQVR